MVNRRAKPRSFPKSLKTAMHAQTHRRMIERRGTIHTPESGDEHAQFPLETIQLPGGHGHRGHDGRTDGRYFGTAH